MEEGDAGTGTGEVGKGLWRLMRFLPRVSAPLTVATAVAVVAGGFLPVVFTVVTGHVVGRVPDAVAGGWGSPAGRALVTLLVVAGVVFVAQQVVMLGRFALADTLGRRAEAVLQRRAMAASALPTGVRHLEDPGLRDTLALARNAAPGQFQPAATVQGLAGALSTRLQPVFALVVVAQFWWWLAVLLAACWIVAQTQLLRYFFGATRAMVVGAGPIRRAVYFRDLALTPAAAKEVRVFGLGDWIAGRFGTGWMDAVRLLWRARTEGRYLTIMTTMIGCAGIFVGVTWVGLAALRGEVDLTALAVLLGAVFSSVGLSVNDTDLAAAYGANAFPAILELEDDVARHPLPVVRQPLPAAAPADAVRFDDVTFRYPFGGHDVLAHLSLAVPAGQSLAIVGANGAGKTTLIKLLARLYDPSEGRVTVDGHDLRAVDPDDWRRRLAILFQDFLRWELSATDNVRLGALHVDGGAERHARLHAAATQAGAIDVIEGLPDGWDTLLSRRMTGGVDLSGGEWQRLALARALFAVAGGARLLVLDEPTANLDVRGEAALYDRFLEVTAGLTTILISHRFSTVRLAGRIVVLDGGRVVEDGSHDDLLAAGGRYARMYTAQAARFTLAPRGADDTSGAHA